MGIARTGQSAIIRLDTAFKDQHALATTEGQQVHSTSYDPAIPLPPTEYEKYSYLQATKWAVVLQAVATMAVIASLVWFSIGVPWAWWGFIPVTLLAAWTFISTTIGLLPRRVTARTHEQTITNHSLNAASVDVFLPSAGEPLKLLANTYKHVSRLQWCGQLTVHVLDDSDRSVVEALAVEHGFRYHVRPNRPHLKKAGNLKYGETHSDGDFIVIFDADFVPRPDMLHETIPYFADPTIGIVQTPQYFDVNKQQNWLQRAAGATQEYFYRWVMPARDRVGGAICVGTCAVYRRQALRESAAGGFAQIGHSEDVHTGVGMLKVGYVTRYVPVVLAKGVCPDNVSGFINQQYRWCAGSMSLLSDRDFHLSGIGVFKFFCFWSGFLYYITTAALVFLAPAPTLYVLWVHPDLVRPANYILVTAAVCLWIATVPLTTSGRGSRVDLARIQTLYSFAHAQAIFDTFILRRTAAWVPTGAAKKSPLVDKVSTVAQTWLLISQGLILIGVSRLIGYRGVDALTQVWPALAYSALAIWTALPLIREVVIVKSQPVKTNPGETRP